MSDFTAHRLQETIRSVGVAITGLRIGTEGDSTTVQVEPISLQSAAQTTIDAFDWSDAAQTLWERDQMRQVAKGHLSATASPAELKLLKAILGLLVDEINTLRGLHSLPARTMAQVRTAIANKLDSGAAD